MKVTMALAALCVALQAPCIGSESTPSNLNNRHLRHEHDSNTPLQRRDEALVPAHRVYDPVSGLACSLVGKCMVCPTSEKDESYCRETGYRQELDCPRVEDDVVHTKSVNQRTTRFRPCSFAEPARPGVAFVKFEVGNLRTLLQKL
uniref:Secreted RxLR effector protein 43 n=1 Tax=Plasmopara viticola TaxID=143451 RepID=RLR43_PLAVT|nr:RecName: Full=Secreted RxLR effector protein 43; Flags: Precursor [Plasmopara viticola]